MLSTFSKAVRSTSFSQKAVARSATRALHATRSLGAKAAAPEFQYQDIFANDPAKEDPTPYYKLTSDHVCAETINGRRVVNVGAEALSLLSRQAMVDIAHLLRPAHLQQLRNILDDPEASDNDKFVALELLKNANIAAGMVLPGCQDTGTAIVMGKRGQNVWTEGMDEVCIRWRVCVLAPQYALSTTLRRRHQVDECNILTLMKNSVPFL